jgi:hypothetical protein
MRCGKRLGEVDFGLIERSLADRSGVPLLYSGSDRQNYGPFVALREA